MPNSNNSYETIPVVTIHDELVDDLKRPTRLMSIFISTIVLVLKDLSNSRLDDAPQDGKLYGRKDGQWVEIV